MDTYVALESELKMLTERMGSNTSTNEIMTRQEQMNAVDETMKIMEGAGKLIFEKIRDMKFVRNTLSPVSKLSMETLQEIYQLLSLFEGSDEDDPHDGGGCTWDWIVVTQVCRHWREVALGYPKLWTQINPSWSQNRVQTYLERSRKADLYITVRDTQSSRKARTGFPAFYQLICKESYRIRDFNILSPIQPRDWMYLQDVFAAGPMPCLRKLQLTTYRRHYTRAGFVNIPSTFIPETSLDHLSLSSVTISWSHHLLRGLKELILNDIMDREQPTVSELLDILEDCPELTILKLYDSGPKVLESNERISRPITLSQLRYVSMDGMDFRNCEEVFNSLRTPEITSIYIGCYKYPFHSPVSFPIMRRNRPAHLSEAKIAVNDHDIALSASENMDSRDTYTVQFRLHFHDGSDETQLLNDIFRCIQIIFTQTFIGNITTMDIDFQNKRLFDENYTKYNMLRSSWVSLLDELQTIQNLRVIFNPSYTIKLTKDFVLALTNSNDTQSYNFKCPDLQTLELVEASFLRLNGAVVDNYEMLLSHLNLRHASSGKKLHRLSLIRCNGISDGHQLPDFCDIFHRED